MIRVQKLQCGYHSQCGRHATPRLADGSITGRYDYYFIYYC